MGSLFDCLLKLVIAVTVLVVGTSWRLSSANFLYQDKFSLSGPGIQVIPQIICIGS